MVSFKGENKQNTDFSNFFHQESSLPKESPYKIPGRNKKHTKLYVVIIVICLSITAITLILSLNK